MSRVELSTYACPWGQRRMQTGSLFTRLMVALRLFLPASEWSSSPTVDMVELFHEEDQWADQGVQSEI